MLRYLDSVGKQQRGMGYFRVDLNLLMKVRRCEHSCEDKFCSHVNRVIAIGTCCRGQAEMNAKMGHETVNLLSSSGLSLVNRFSSVLQ